VTLLRAQNDEDLDKLLAIVRSNPKVQIMDGVMMSHHPRTARMLEEVKHLGHIERINSSFSFHSALRRAACAGLTYPGS